MSQFVQIGTAPAANKSCTAPAVAPKGIVQLQVITIAWMLVECGVSLVSARNACSPALLAFGSDSLVELLSASVVLLQFLPRFPLGRKQATRAGAVLLFVLAAVVAATAIVSLVRGARPEASLSGVMITVAALIAMPILAWRKGTLAKLTNDSALAADAVQSATCAYLAAITLAGLGINALFHLAWVDSAAALVAIPILIVEGRRALRGESCGCC